MAALAVYKESEEWGWRAGALEDRLQPITVRIPQKNMRIFFSTVVR